MISENTLKKLNSVMKAQVIININTIVNFLQRIRSDNEYIQLREIKEQFIYNTDKRFNLFKELTNRDNLDEKFYSKVLSKILDPNTPEIGNIEYLNTFMELICKINKKVIKHNFSKEDVVVKCEENHIDIVIRDSTYAVIIENKIANAKDQPDQLARYCEEIIKTGLKPIAIVYIPSNPYKKPSLNTYSKKYNHLKEQIENNYVHLPVICSNSSNTNDLAKGFLNECVVLSDKHKHTLANVFIEQFSKLVHQKGVETMVNLSREKIIEKIFSDYSFVEVADEIYKLWDGNNKGYILGKLLSDKLKEKIKVLKKNEDDDPDPVLSVQINDVNVTLWANDLAIGLTYRKEKNIPKDIKEKFKEILGKKEFLEYFSEIEVEQKTVAIYFQYDDFKKSLNDVVDFLTIKINKLIDYAKELKV